MSKSVGILAVLLVVPFVAAAPTPVPTPVPHEDESSTGDYQGGEHKSESDGKNGFDGSDSSSTHAALSTIHAELSTTRAALSKTRAALSESRAALSETRAAISETRAAISTARAELSATLEPSPSPSTLWGSSTSIGSGASTVAVAALGVVAAVLLMF